MRNSSNWRKNYCGRFPNWESEDDTVNSSSVKVPSEVRKAKIAQVKALLDRETALVEGAKSRLEKLTLS